MSTSERRPTEGGEFATVFYGFAVIFTTVVGVWMWRENRPSRAALAWSAVALAGLFAGLVFPAHVTGLSVPARWLYVVGVAVALSAGLYGSRRSRSRAAADTDEDRPASPR
ncbi:MAG: hypothetical protein ACRDQ0_18255 [Pseudonocardia sp.]